MRDANGKYELTVHPQGRTAADEYWHQGNVFIEGRDNSTYTLRFTNHTNRRVVAIFGVDGLCIQTGKPAGPDSPGYVVDAGKTLEVPGWSIDKNTAAEFYFSRKDDSYVNKIGGDSSNAGVIGCMVFEEAYPVQQPFYFQNTNVNSTGYTGVRGPVSLNNLAVSNTFGSNAITAGAVSSSFTASDVGTGVGDVVDFKVVDTPFKRFHPTTPNTIVVMYYNSAKNLQRMGITLKTKRFDTSNSPNPFPGTYRYGITPPTDWNS